MNSPQELAARITLQWDQCQWQYRRSSENLVILRLTHESTRLWSEIGITHHHGETSFYAFVHAPERNPVAHWKLTSPHSEQVNHIIGGCLLAYLGGRTSDPRILEARARYAP